MGGGIFQGSALDRNASRWPFCGHGRTRVTRAGHSGIFSPVSQVFVIGNQELQFRCSWNALEAAQFMDSKIDCGPKTSSLPAAVGYHSPHDPDRHPESPAPVAKPMNLEWQVCSRARLSRDARFDDKFFIDVLSTRIYCRSICPARTCNESNVRYYPSAAAAAEAGFRPCLRCRPESSPGTPAWLGTSNTVSRALRLIGESGLEDGGVEVLAERLGVGSRHLRRLFLQHLGATPIAVAHTRRLHFAKKLIDETSLPMSHVAQASGFGCVRRFNAAIRKIYHRTPTQIRRLAHQKTTFPENQYLFRLRFRPPYQWESMLAFLAARATPGVEVVELGSYRRSISLNNSDGYFEVSLDESREALSGHIQCAQSPALFLIVERIRRMFDLSADWQVIAARLRTDPALAARIESLPALRVPGCWDGFELATRVILGQQNSVN